VSVLPAGGFRNEGIIVEIGIVAIARLSFSKLHALLDLLIEDSFASGLKHILAAFEEEQAKDEIFVGGGVHPFAAEDVGSGVKVAFEFGE
jgi:hypothetical protein